MGPFFLSCPTELCKNYVLSKSRSMKKGILLALFTGLMSLEAMAQSLVHLDPKYMGSNASSYDSPQSNPFYRKGVLNEWFNFMDAADANQGGLIRVLVYDNNTLFPDSLVLQRYGDSISGYRLGSVNKHSIGQVFDPTSFYYPDMLSPGEYYQIDSVSIAYRYTHHVPGSVDTLEFQIYSDTAVKTGILPGIDPESTAWVNYDRQSGKGLEASQTWRILIDADDTSRSSYKVLNLDLPYYLQVKPGGLVALTYRYIPGYSYSPGDTIDPVWNDPVPGKRLNHFQPLVGIDTAKTEEDSYNHGLSIRTFNKYAADSTESWANAFIPGDAWDGFTEYVYIGFKVYAIRPGLETIERNSVQVYPNPATATENVTIAFTTKLSTDITVELYDLLGNKVQTLMDGNAEAGKQTVIVNSSSLPSGFYVYRIEAGDQFVSGKLSIIN
ncbi:MAG TPA: hypothetical protein DIW47_09565 [Bacteroidetes bacterium]|nr:hypothetical protein [Bacteroidota bacterium]